MPLIVWYVLKKKSSGSENFSFRALVEVQSYSEDSIISRSQDPLKLL
jgi:hypothetical protein